MDDDFDDDEFDPDKTKDDSDDDEYVATVSQGPRQTRYNTRHSVDASNKKKTAEAPKVKVDPASGSNSDEEDAQRQLISFMPNADSVEFDNNTSNRYRSIRKFYGKNESVFIMDAKKLGNIGRYFNVSACRQIHRSSSLIIAFLFLCLNAAFLFAEPIRTKCVRRYTRSAISMGRLFRVVSHSSWQ